MRGKGTVGRRLLSLASTLIIAVSMTPTTAFAENNTIEWQDGRAVYDVVMPDGVAVSGIETRTVNETADTYVWNLTSQQTYLPPSGTNGGQRHNRTADAWRAQFWSGTTSDGYIQIHVRNINTSESYYQSIDAYHECSQPKSSYSPGEEACLTMRAYVQNPVNFNYCRGSSHLYISQENKEADGIQFGTYVSNNKNSLADFCARGQSSTWLSPRDESAGKYINASATVYAEMPKSTTVGEHIAIVFSDGTGSDSASSSPQYEYGGTAFHLWIYTLEKKSKPATVTVAKTKITKVKKTNSKSFRVTWKKLSGVTGYQLQLSKTSKFKKASTTSATIAKKYNYINIKNFPKGTWYIRVRAYKTKNGKKTYGKWSTVKQYKWKK